MTLYQLAIAVIALSAISMLTVSAFADTGCRRDCEPPTLGVLYTGQQVVEKGFTINGRPFNVDEHTQTLPTTFFRTGETIKIKLLVYENSGASYLRDTSLSIGKYVDDRHVDIVATISFKQVFSAVLGQPLLTDSDVTQTSSVLDPNGILSDVTVKATNVDSYRTAINISFKVTKPLDASDIIIQTMDAERGTGTNVLHDAIQVRGKDLAEKAPEPVKQVPAPLKQVKNKVAAKNITCREGFELVIRTTGAPACVYPVTADTLRNLRMAN